MKLLWRVLFVVLFIPLGIWPLLWSFGCIIVAGVAWVGRGPSAKGDRIERWAFGKVGTALAWPLDALMRKADVLKDMREGPR